MTIAPDQSVARQHTMNTEVDAMSTPHKPHPTPHIETPHADPAHAPGKQHLDLGHIRDDSRTKQQQYSRATQAQRVVSRAPRGQRGS